MCDMTALCRLHPEQVSNFSIVLRPVLCLPPQQCSESRGSAVKEKGREVEGEEMSLCLYECLKAVGLQQYYVRFTSVGVCSVVHLSGLTMEDYPILGIRSMEDRTQLFHLVQMVKTLQLESLECHDDDDYDTDDGDKGYAVADSSITFDGCGDPAGDVYDDEDEKGAAVSELNADSFSKPSHVRRRLDFSCENIDHQKLFSHPVSSVYVCASHNRNNEPGQGRGSAIPVQHEIGAGSAVVCSSKDNSNHWLDVHTHQHDHHTGANTKPDSVDRNSFYNSQTRLSPKCASSHKPNPRHSTVASKRFSNKLVGHRDRKGISKKEKFPTEISSNEAPEHMAVATPVYESKTTAGYNYGLPLTLPAPNKNRQSGGQRISVCVRKRPLTHTECRRGEADVVTTPSTECVIVRESKEAVDLTQYILQHRFYFDQVFGEETSNKEVYQKTAYPLVQHMLNGGKATCFAYGQTGAGKTHTMLGSSPGRPGLYALAVQDIFAHLSTTHMRSPLLVYVSFFEIYCGQLYDLLDHRKRLFAREDGQKVVHIAGLRDVRVDSVSSLLEVISHGTEERTQGMSGVNPLSSRSHALLQIQLRGPNQQTAGRMWFVDLAGSERASDTKEPDRRRRMEGAEINQSLLALKECIRSLDQEQSHTPFRQSKLTQVLKDSFVGDSMTCMIANISPGHLATEHTLNTLRYADRVKELRGGGGGFRGGRRDRTVHSPKRSLSNSNSSRGPSSVGTREKGSPKKPKLWRQRQTFGPTTPSSSLATGGEILCSTPKSRKWGEKTSTRARKAIGLEQITPIRGLLGINNKRESRDRASGREGRRRETYGGTDSAGHSTGDQNIGTGMKGGEEGERRWIEQRGQAENSIDACGEGGRLGEGDLQKAHERDKERERHLKRYHQQLQQFTPTSASSSDHHLFSSSTCGSSSSSSNQDSLSSSSCVSASALVYHDFEEFLDAHRASAEVRTGGNRGQLSSFLSEEICVQTETSPCCKKNKDEVGHGDSGGISEDWRVSLKGAEAGFGQVRSKNERMRSLMPTGESKVRVRKGDLRPAGMKQEGERRWAWVATTETEQTNRMTGARPAGVEPQVSCNRDSEVGEEGLDASYVSADGVWSTEEQEGADGYAVVSTHSNDGSNSLFNPPPVESSHQRAPAERPLSPPCEHTNTLLTPSKLSDLSLPRCKASNILPLPMQNAQQGVPSISCGEKEEWFTTKGNKGKVSNAQLSTLSHNNSITWNGCKIPALSLTDNILSENRADKARMSVVTQGETSTDCLSYIMDPLSISLLQVDQQAATDSFLQGEQNNSSICPLENEMNESKVEEGEDIEFHLSLLDLPQAKTHCPPKSDSMTATNHPERKQDVYFATDKHCGIDPMRPHIPEVTLVSLQDQENNQKLQTTPASEVVDNKAPASLLKSTACASKETSAMQSISAPVQHSGNSGSPNPQNLMANGATQMPQEHSHSVHSGLTFSIPNSQSESVLSRLKTLPKQYHTVNSNHSRNSTISLQPSSTTESKSEESTNNLHIRPLIHLSMLEDFYHCQWRVVQAHWEQLEEMENLSRKEGMLLCQQPDMAFGEYVHKLGEIMEKKAQCIHSMIAQLQPHLKTSHSNQPHNQGMDNHD
nr:uncharacterized protein LOC124058362 isoform X2 [Scatophagus argus]